MSPAPATPAPGDEAASFCAALVDEWVRLGVRHAVVAPGSRSTPLALALLRQPGIQVHVFHDERSASFAALGVGRVSGRPAVLLCTSGTAAAQFHAAVVEAHLADVPLIVCTADRPPEARDVGSPQTIDQVNLYGTSVRWFHDPGVPALAAASSWRSLAARAVAASTGTRPGPVHLNLPFREPLLGSPVHVPPARDGGWMHDAAAPGVDESACAEAAALLSGGRVVVVAGAGSDPSVLESARRVGWPVFADPSSGLRTGDSSVVCAFDPILRASPPSAGAVLRVGDPPASKVLAQWVDALDVPVVQVTASGRIVDPSHRVSVHLHGDVPAIVARLADRAVTGDDAWSSWWRSAEAAARAVIADWTGSHHGEPSIAAVVASAVRPGTQLVLSSSMPIRDLEWFGGPMPGVTVHANRGANGIDGVVSTAVGVALASGAPTTLLIGDVACLHDANGLIGAASRGVDMDIVVVNNDGGAIFSFLPQRAATDDAEFETLWGTPHGVSFAALAAAHGIGHVAVEDVSELAGVLGPRGVRLVEVRTDRAGNTAEHDALNAAVAAAIPPH